uniref:Basic tail secreted protein n=1 Tax=Rhipicephalus appendiculatus TaxID=34631 RepID=A0A131YGL2_RHIAP
MPSLSGLLCLSTIAFASAIPRGFLDGPMMKIERRCTPIPYSNFIMCITSEIAVIPPIGVIVGDGLDEEFKNGIDLPPWLLEQDPTSDKDSELNASSDGPDAEQSNPTKDTTADPPSSDAAAPVDSSAPQATGEENASSEGSRAA